MHTEIKLQSINLIPCPETALLRVGQRLLYEDAGGRQASTATRSGRAFYPYAQIPTAQFLMQDRSNNLLHALQLQQIFSKWTRRDPHQLPKQPS